MAQHWLLGRTLLFLQLECSSDVLTGLSRPAHEVQHKGAIALCSGVFRIFIHSGITATQHGFQLISSEGIKTAWNGGIALSR